MKIRMDFHTFFERTVLPTPLGPNKKADPVFPKIFLISSKRLTILHKYNINMELSKVKN